MTRDERIRQLVAELDQDNTNDADDAQFALIEDYGAEALGALLEAARGFGDYGQLCAIEVLEAVRPVGDPRVAEVLIPWLRSENRVVRDWTAGALGRIGAVDAIPELLAAWEAAKTRGTPPDETEPVSIRHALATLGARAVVVPDTAARSRIDDDRLGQVWPASVVADVLTALADASQVILFVQYWTRRPQLDPASWYGITEAGVTVDLDWSAPWDQLVDEARRQAVAAVGAQAPTIPRDTVVNDRVDRPQRRLISAVRSRAGTLAASKARGRVRRSPPVRPVWSSSIRRT